MPTSPTVGIAHRFFTIFLARFALMTLHEFPAPEAWLEAMVAGWEALGGPALKARGTFNVSLSGGSTPKPLYQRLAKLSWPWSATHLYLGAERSVEPDHTGTNLGDPPRFDLVLLGIGDDGHTSSLFPETAALKETKLLMAPNFVPKLGVWRVTSTYTLLRYARAVWFVTRGPSKEPYIRALSADDSSASFPAAKVRSDRGTVEIYHCTAP